MRRRHESWKDKSRDKGKTANVHRETHRERQHEPRYTERERPNEGEDVPNELLEAKITVGPTQHNRVWGEGGPGRGKSPQKIAPYIYFMGPEDFPN